VTCKGSLASRFRYHLNLVISFHQIFLQGHLLVFSFHWKHYYCYPCLERPFAKDSIMLSFFPWGSLTWTTPSSSFLCLVIFQEASQKQQKKRRQRTLVLKLDGFKFGKQFQGPLKWNSFTSCNNANMQVKDTKDEETMLYPDWDFLQLAKARPWLGKSRTQQKSFSQCCTKRVPWNFLFGITW